MKKFIDKGFTVSSAWVKEHDEGVYETLLEMLEEFAADPGNSADDDDVKEFKAGNWFVHYFFSDAFCGEGEINIEITAGRDGQMLANQPPWIDEFVDAKDIKLGAWNFDLYSKMLEAEDLGEET